MLTCAIMQYVPDDDTCIIYNDGWETYFRLSARISATTAFDGFHEIIALVILFRTRETPPPPSFARTRLLFSRASVYRRPKITVAHILRSFVHLRQNYHFILDEIVSILHTRAHIRIYTQDVITIVGALFRFLNTETNV